MTHETVSYYPEIDLPKGMPHPDVRTAQCWCVMKCVSQWHDGVAHDVVRERIAGPFTHEYAVGLVNAFRGPGARIAYAKWMIDVLCGPNRKAAEDPAWGHVY